MHDRHMSRAIEIARGSLGEDGALPYGAVVVRDGEIVGEGLNRALALHDPTSHGEIEAIRDACRRLGTTDLAGCTVYTTAEPCSMCVATMYATGVDAVYYALAADDSARFIQVVAARDERFVRRMGGDALRQEVGKPIADRQMTSAQLMKDEAQQVFDSFAGRSGD